MGKTKAKAMVAFALWAAGGLAQAACSAPAPAESLTISQLAGRSAGCFKSGQEQEASVVFYAMQIRARGIAQAIGGETSDSAKALQAQLGAPTNRYSGGDLGEWVQTIRQAVAWENNAPWPEIGHLGQAAAKAQQAREQAREALLKMALDIESMDKGKFYKQRKAAGLEVREPGF